MVSTEWICLTLRRANQSHHADERFRSHFWFQKSEGMKLVPVFPTTNQAVGATNCLKPSVARDALSQLCGGDSMSIAAGRDCPSVKSKPYGSSSLLFILAPVPHRTAHSDP